MMFARDNIIVRGYDFFILKGLENVPFHTRLNVNKSHIEGYLFFAFDNNDIVVNRFFAEDLWTIFMHIPLITRVDTYATGIVDLWELFKRFIEIKDFELMGKIVEYLILYLNKFGVFNNFHYSQGWFLFSVDLRKYYETLLLLSEYRIDNDILIKNGIKLLDGNGKIFRKCDEVEQNSRVSASDKVYENGRYKHFDGYRIGVTEQFDVGKFELK